MVVEDLDEANTSLGLAELLGYTKCQRSQLTKQQFIGLVEMFETHRDHIENLLSAFDEETQSWRDYAGYAFSFLPDELDQKVEDYLKPIVEKAMT